MGELYDKYKAQKELDEQNIIRENTILENTTREYNDLDKSIRSIKESEENRAIRFSKFKNTLKDVLLSEALYKIYSPCLGENPNRSAKIFSENLIYDFVQKNGGADTILAKKRGVSYAIESLYNNIEDHYKLIVEKASKDDPKIEKEDMESFLNKLDDDADVENVSQAIAMRVANAEEEFINNNMSDKITIKNIVDDTAARINAAKSDGSIDLTDEEIEQEANLIYREKMDKNKARPKSIFEFMVQNLATDLMKSNNEAYKENDKINIGKVVESAKCVYGVLETVNTLKLENVNEEYIMNMF